MELPDRPLLRGRERLQDLDVPQDGEGHRDEDVVAGLLEPARRGLVVHGRRALVLVEGDHPGAEPDARPEPGDERAGQPIHAALDLDQVDVAARDLLPQELQEGGVHERLLELEEAEGLDGALRPAALLEKLAGRAVVPLLHDGRPRAIALARDPVGEAGDRVGPERVDGAAALAVAQGEREAGRIRLHLAETPLAGRRCGRTPAGCPS